MARLLQRVWSSSTVRVRYVLPSTLYSELSGAAVCDAVCAHPQGNGSVVSVALARSLTRRGFAIATEGPGIGCGGSPLRRILALTHLHLLHASRIAHALVYWPEASCATGGWLP